MGIFDRSGIIRILFGKHVKLMFWNVSERSGSEKKFEDISCNFAFLIAPVSWKVLQLGKPYFY